MREVISLGILPLFASNTGCGLCKTFPKFHVCIRGVRKRNLWKNNLLARVEWARASLWVDKIAHPQNKGPSRGVLAGFPQGSNLRSRGLLRLCTVDTTKISSLTPKGKRCRALRDPRCYIATMHPFLITFPSKLAGSNLSLPKPSRSQLLVMLRGTRSTGGRSTQRSSPFAFFPFSPCTLQPDLS